MTLGRFALLGFVLLFGSCATYAPLPLPKGLVGLELAVEEEPEARGWLGLEVMANESDSLEDLQIRPGVRVLSVAAGSPAEEVGIRPGDVLLKLDGTPVDDPDRLESILMGVVEQQDSTLTVERGTRVFETQVKILIRESDGNSRTLYHVERGLVRAAFRNTRKSGAYPEVAVIAEDSPLRDAGVQVGDRILSFQGADPGSAGELVRRLGIELQPGDPGTFEIERKNGERATVEFTAWSPGRIVVARRAWPFFTWEYDQGEDKERLIIGDLILLSLFKRERLGHETEYSIVSVIGWKSGEPLLESSMHPELTEVDP